MRSYVYSIIVRFYLAFTGFLVFLLTATLFGAEGRGVIGFGTSLFAMISIIFSANLGRTFLSITRQREDLKKDLLRKFLKLNGLLTLAAAAVGLLYCQLSYSAQEVISATQAICFSMTSLFYVWSINGNAFFASIAATRKQENIIIFFRTVIIIFLAALYLNHEKSLDYFIVCYSAILFIGTLAEILWLYFKSSPSKNPQFKASTEILKEAFFHHVDFLSFNIFPLLLTVLLASYTLKSDVGRFNFALQIINLIFLFSTTANIRLIAYVSDVGFRARIAQFKKLFWATLSISAFSILILSFLLGHITNFSKFEQFKGAEVLFLISGLAIPGYVLYQFFSPIWIELQKQKIASCLHLINFIFFALLSPYFLNHYKLLGAVWLFAFFHIGLILTQGYLYKNYIKK